jgi:acetolactate synthase I/II/III large subunit
MSYLSSTDGQHSHTSHSVLVTVAQPLPPRVQTLMGLGSFPESRPAAHGMLGMHGTVSANCAVDEADLLLAIGVRFDDRVTGKLETFAARARIVHIDVDPAEIHKNKAAHVPVRAACISCLLH